MAGLCPGQLLGENMQVTEIRITVPRAGDPIVYITVAPDPGENEMHVALFNEHTVEELKSLASSIRSQVAHGA